MKSVFIILSLAALTWGQLDFECLCGMFVTTEIAMLEVHRLPPINVGTCTEANECSLICYQEWDYIFSNGGLNFPSPGTEMTVGEHSCMNLARVHNITDFEAAPLYGYYKLCDLPWIFDGGVSRDDLCCRNSMQC